MKVLLASDHAGYALKEKLLKSDLAEWVDMGPDSDARVDYPDFAHKACKALLAGKADYAVMICGSGQGMAMAANKHKGIRAALCWSEEIASLAKEHNNANVLCLASRFVSESEAVNICKAFFAAKFEGGRHLQRVEKIEV